MRRLLPVLLLVVFGCQQATQQVQTAPPEPEPAPTAEPEAVIRMLAARRAERSGNTFRAVVEWQAACAADPTSLTIRFGLTKALMENGQTSHSLAEARSILDEDSTYVPVRSFLADYHQARNEFDEAARHLEVVVAATADERAGWRLAGIYNDQHRQDDVIRVLDGMARHEETTPRDLLRWTNVANTLHMDSALVHLYTVGLERWPADEDLVIAYGDYLTRAERQQDLERLYRTSLEASPGMRRVAFRLSALLSSQNRWTEVDSLMSNVLISSEVELRAAKGWLEAAIQRGELALAERELAELMARFPDDAGLGELLGVTQLALDRPAEARETFVRVAESDSSFRALLGLARAYLAMDSLRQAEATARAAIGRHGDSPPLANTLGRSLAQQERWADALPYLAAAARADRRNPQFSYDLGVALEQTGRYEEAAGVFRYLLQLTPDNPAVLNYLGYMLADQNMSLEEAHRFVSRAVELEPDNGAYLDSMGWVLFRMGRLQEAERYLLSALEKEGPDPVILDHVGDVSQALGKLSEARDYWTQALNADPDNERIRRKLQQGIGE